MKLKIKVLRTNKALPLPGVFKIGDWVDLRAAKTIKLTAPHANSLKEKARKVEFDNKLIPLGIAMQLPDGFEAQVLPRSSTFKHFGITMVNSEGVIDQEYRGNTDEWQFGAMAFRDTVVKEGDRIAQFRIQLSQKATFWQKLKWLFSSGIEIVEVDSLNNEGRGGIGSTGKN